MLAITLTAPPQRSQVKMSILNTRFNRCAYVIETWRVGGARRWSVTCIGHAGRASLVLAIDGSAQSPRGVPGTDASAPDYCHPLRWISSQRRVLETIDPP